MNDLSFVSIIIPCKKFGEYEKECVEHCKNLNYDNFEILLLPDHTSEKIEGVRIISTGNVTPGKKRNIGIFNSRAEYCAFIDSDAFPNKDWLNNAMKYFEDPLIAGVGGPGLTPKDDFFMQKASGRVLSSFMVGNMSARYQSESNKESDDIHSCNFVARKEVLKEAGGWNEKYWPGEDTLMCRSIRKLGKKLVEVSDVEVFHHRRPLFRKHLKQVSQFGLHRGFFSKKFPENSFRPTYFGPSLLLLFMIFGGALSLFIPLMYNLFIIFLSVYAVTSLYASLNKDIKMIGVVWIGIILTHLIYGSYFLIGITKRDLRR